MESADVEAKKRPCWSNTQNAGRIGSVPHFYLGYIACPESRQTAAGQVGVNRTPRLGPRITRTSLGTSHTTLSLNFNLCEGDAETRNAARKNGWRFCFSVPGTRLREKHFGGRAELPISFRGRPKANAPPCGGALLLCPEQDLNLHVLTNTSS